MATRAPAILFEDESLLAVDKPAGIHTAPLRAGETGTVLDFVIAAHPEIARVPGIKRVEPGLLHRLDRETSGIVICARTAGAFAALRRQFDENLCLKEYFAACAPSGARSEIGAYFSVESRFATFGPGRRKVRIVVPDEKRKKLLREATRESYRTDAEIVAALSGIVLLRAKITRGFRHQVRAHLSFRGYPILGDPLYGSPAPPGLPARMYLHASRLEIAHPVTSLALIIESPLPEEFRVLFPCAR
jgi:23S rRNA pseudouridine1911/1915/1917 synthase